MEADDPCGNAEELSTIKIIKKKKPKIEKN